jgi:hypothetical protein
MVKNDGPVMMAPAVVFCAATGAASIAAARASSTAAARWQLCLPAAAMGVAISVAGAYCCWPNLCAAVDIGDGSAFEVAPKSLLQRIEIA